MPELPRPSDRVTHLDVAEAYSRQLDRECLEERDISLANATFYNLDAAQGYAMRRLIYHCTAAIVEAIREARDG